jgi:dihydroorotase
MRFVICLLWLAFSIAAPPHLSAQTPSATQPNSATQSEFDLLLKGGHVIDPKNQIDGVADVAIANGHIARVAKNIPASLARKVVDVRGLYVTPGLVDIHVHVYPRYILPPGAPPSEGVQPDSFSFRNGVTTMVDAGSTGWREFPEFRDRVIKNSKTRVLAFLNIVGAGMGTGNDNNVSEMDAQAAAQMAEANPTLIVGFKSAHYAGAGWSSVDNAVEAGKLAHLPVMVDFGLITAQRNIDTLFSQKLRPGDIYTHCFSGHREEVLQNGKLNPAMQSGRQRGIIFDIGFGAASFYWYVAAPAYQAGFYPDSISTDLHREERNEGLHSMPYIMSELMDLGSSLHDVVKMATSDPAQEIKHPELGNLDGGAEADVAVLRMEQGQFQFSDSAGARKAGTRRLVDELTLRKGEVVWDMDGLASQDWQKFTYRKGPFFHSDGHM